MQIRGEGRDQAAADAAKLSEVCTRACLQFLEKQGIYASFDRHEMKRLHADNASMAASLTARSSTPQSTARSLQSFRRSASPENSMVSVFSSSWMPALLTDRSARGRKPREISISLGGDALALPRGDERVPLKSSRSHSSCPPREEDGVWSDRMNADSEREDADKDDLLQSTFKLLEEEKRKVAELQKDLALLKIQVAGAAPQSGGGVAARFASSSRRMLAAEVCSEAAGYWSINRSASEADRGAVHSPPSLAQVAGHSRNPDAGFAVPAYGAWTVEGDSAGSSRGAVAPGAALKIAELNRQVSECRGLLSCENAAVSDLRGKLEMLRSGLALRQEAGASYGYGRSLQLPAASSPPSSLNADVRNAGALTHDPPSTLATAGGIKDGGAILPFEATIAGAGAILDAARPGFRWVDARALQDRGDVEAAAAPHRGARASPSAHQPLQPSQDTSVVGWRISSAQARGKTSPEPTAEGQPSGVGLGDVPIAIGPSIIHCSLCRCGASARLPLLIRDLAAVSQEFETLRSSLQLAVQEGIRVAACKPEANPKRLDAHDTPAERSLPAKSALADAERNPCAELERARHLLRIEMLVVGLMREQREVETLWGQSVAGFREILAQQGQKEANRRSPKHGSPAGAQTGCAAEGRWMTSRPALEVVNGVKLSIAELGVFSAELKNYLNDGERSILAMKSELEAERRLAKEQEQQLRCSSDLIGSLQLALGAEAARARLNEEVWGQRLKEADAARANSEARLAEMGNQLTSLLGGLNFAMSNQQPRPTSHDSTVSIRSSQSQKNTGIRPNDILIGSDQEMSAKSQVSGASYDSTHSLNRPSQSEADTARANFQARLSDAGIQVMDQAAAMRQISAASHDSAQSTLSCQSEAEAARANFPTRPADTGLQAAGITSGVGQAAATSPASYDSTLSVGSSQSEADTARADYHASQADTGIQVIGQAAATSQIIAASHDSVLSVRSSQYEADPASAGFQARLADTGLQAAGMTRGVGQAVATSPASYDSAPSTRSSQSEADAARANFQARLPDTGLQAMGMASDVGQAAVTSPASYDSALFTRSSQSEADAARSNFQSRLPDTGIQVIGQAVATSQIISASYDAVLSVRSSQYEVDTARANFQARLADTGLRAAGMTSDVGQVTATSPASYDSDAARANFQARPAGTGLQAMGIASGVDQASATSPASHDSALSTRSSQSEADAARADFHTRLAETGLQVGGQAAKSHIIASLHDSALSVRSSQSEADTARADYQTHLADTGIHVGGQAAATSQIIAASHDSALFVRSSQSESDAARADFQAHQADTGLQAAGMTSGLGRAAATSPASYDSALSTRSSQSEANAARGDFQACQADTGIQVIGQAAATSQIIAASYNSALSTRSSQYEADAAKANFQARLVDREVEVMGVASSLCQAVATSQQPRPASYDSALSTRSNHSLSGSGRVAITPLDLTAVSRALSTSSNQSAEPVAYRQLNSISASELLAAIRGELDPAVFDAISARAASLTPRASSSDSGGQPFEPAGRPQSMPVGAVWGDLTESAHLAYGDGFLTSAAAQAAGGAAPNRGWSAVRSTVVSGKQRPRSAGVVQSI